MDRRTATLAAPAPPLAIPDRGLGERVRRLRTAHGLTQTELAEARVSKEYISQIETGKARPTSQTLEWLAERLGVDTYYLVDGVSDSEHREHEAIVCQAEEAVQYAGQVAGDAADESLRLVRAAGPACPAARQQVAHGTRQEKRRLQTRAHVRFEAADLTAEDIDVLETAPQTDLAEPLLQLRSRRHRAVRFARRRSQA